MAVTIEIVTDAAKLANRGADLFAAAAQTAAAARGAFTVALSGGSTPRGLYEALARRYAGMRMPWPRVHLYWGDERCVPPDHPDSNYGMARAALVARVAVPPENVHRMRGEEEPDAAARAYEAELRSPPLGPGIAAAGASVRPGAAGRPGASVVGAPAGPASRTGVAAAGTPVPGSAAPAGPARRRSVVEPRGAARVASTVAGAVPVAGAADRLPVLDLVLLGLGGDGHTASLFPHMAALDEVERLCAPTTAPDGSPRLTLTFPVINAARRVVFLVSGAGKAGMVAEVLEGLRMPAAIPAQRVDAQLGELVWLLDEAAASELSPAALAAARRP